jgi:acetolactate synthase-1/2/3 large subunit
VEHPTHLEEALAACLSSTGPFLLDVSVEQQENCFPMIPAGQGHHEMLLGVDRPYTGTALVS